MTAFTPSNIPSTVTTLESLAVWVSAALFQIDNALTAIEGSGTPVQATQFGQFYVASNNTFRVISRLSLQLNDTYAIDGKPVWQEVQELSTTAIPSQFLPSS